MSMDKTRPVKVNIGERRKPRPEGRPGFLRVDSVHQGDLDGIKGLYHINLVDEVSQFQFIGSVERISERFLLPVLEALIRAFPFIIHGFHADNGSEYINRQVAALLGKLHVEEFTKSRARRTNDNALVESKNGSVVRKHLGYAHIPGRFAQQVNHFTQNVLSSYLNFHRPCFFPTEEIDAKGRVRKRYRYEDMMTCAWRNVIQAATGSWNRPPQCFRHAYILSVAGCATLSPLISAGVLLLSDACVRE